MKRFREVSVWMQATVASAALLIKDQFELQFKGSKLEDYALIPLILATIVAMKFADQGANFMLDHLRWLRKALSGTDDIEGDWVNIVLDIERPDDIKYVEFCKIHFHDGQYVSSGDTWTLDGAWVQEFSSGALTYQDKESTYAYRTGLNSVGGYGTIRFSPYDAVPTDFIGRYQDDNSKRPHITRGRRLQLSARTLSVEERRQKAITFAQEFTAKKLLSVAEAMPQFD